MIANSERACIEDLVHKEYVRSVAKHGEWTGYTCTGMLLVIAGELCEVAFALLRRDLHGPHGAFIELAQVMSSCQKMMVQIMRRERITRRFHDDGCPIDDLAQTCRPAGAHSCSGGCDLPTSLTHHQEGENPSNSPEGVR